MAPRRRLNETQHGQFSETSERAGNPKPRVSYPIRMSVSRPVADSADASVADGTVKGALSGFPDVSSAEKRPGH